MTKKGDTVHLTVSDIAEGDRCYGRLESGMSVFVQGRLAIGDEVEAVVFKTKKNYIEAKLHRILSPSPDRVPPKCFHFGVCGGCKWQHVSYAAQLRQKEKQVSDALLHIGGFKTFLMKPAIHAPHIFNYRNKVDFSFSNQRYLLPEEIGVEEGELQKRTDFALGFHAPRRYDKAIDIDNCDIASPEMNTVLHIVKAFCLEKKLTAYSTVTHEGFLRNLVIRSGENTGELMVNLVTSWHDTELMQELEYQLKEALQEKLTTFVNNISTKKNTVAFGEEEFCVIGKGHITETLGNYAFDISANSFFQTNSAQTLNLYQKTREFAKLSQDDIVYDLYCGTGSISIFISDACQKVLGIELVDSAIEDAKKNAERNDVKNCAFRMLDLKDFGKISPELEAFGLPDVVITDPPRAGMHPKAVQMLLRLSPKRIVYVSCNPASLARDGQLFCENGEYQLLEAQPVDMFPHTNHIESVAVFEKQ
ncbi:RNA methyltransferase, TrmA family [Chloroherpeton thalassium ATCC 35110]|uniref:RNA methyltransferase, TrmA family n=1 Tax=Chloroherpeton thalassium (strain ATCC 35110 / GB-78) TaxID=517418 RepID=B3QUF9_CHLT3|nr:23S rRNA (uracil(1939)-C(5))-methyltransferase RlmD [Chloroherpeton thalassium]ACF14408.1 RNA methyltransferase, TrmA family [Chloroherpeton thalassium ATCC 35110]